MTVRRDTLYAIALFGNVSGIIMGITLAQFSDVDPWNNAIALLMGFIIAGILACQTMFIEAETESGVL